MRHVDVPAAPALPAGQRLLLRQLPGSVAAQGAALHARDSYPRYGILWLTLQCTFCARVCICIYQRLYVYIGYTIAPLKRCFCVPGFLLYSTWAWNIICAPDVFSWNFTFMLLNMGQTLYIIYQMRPVKVNRELEAMYEALFQPLNVSLSKLFLALSLLSVCALFSKFRLRHGKSFLIPCLLSSLPFNF